MVLWLLESIALLFYWTSSPEVLLLFVDCVLCQFYFLCSCNVLFSSLLVTPDFGCQLSSPALICVNDPECL